MDGLIEGRIVHYVMESGDHRPAIVVQVMGKETGSVALTIFLAPHDPEPVTHGNLLPVMIPLEGRYARYSPDNAPGTWHWIGRA